MAKVNATILRVTVGGIPIGGTKSYTLNLGRSNIDISNKDSAGYTERMYGSAQWTITFDGLYDPSLTFNVEEIYSMLEGISSATVQVGGGGLTYMGTATASNLTLNSNAEEVVTISGTFEGTSSLTGTSDWYLPSYDALQAMRTQLYANSKGSFSGIYWSSTENNATTAYALNFGTNAWSTPTKNTSENVRPMRNFNSLTSYALGDAGEAGWIIYKASDGSGGYNYWEAALADITAAAWSNVTASACGAVDTSLTEGLANTNTIVAQTNHTTSAAQDCLNYVA